MPSPDSAKSPERPQTAPPLTHPERGSALSRIVLHLARNPGFPEGSRRHGYEIIAPLDPSGHLDPEAWKSLRRRCRVRRFWGNEPGRHGFLVHRPGGVGGATWLIDYNQDSSEDDEAAYRLDSHVLAKGQYVSIRDEDGVVHTFQVVEVEPAGGAVSPPA
jgi:hypothetical protein